MYQKEILSFQLMGAVLTYQKQSDDLNYVLILDSTEKIETKYIDISDQKIIILAR